MNEESEQSFKMQIKTNLRQNNMTDPNQPQKRFYMQRVSPTAFNAWYDSDILQVMATTTKAILTNVRQDPLLEDKFSIMYTPMNTGDTKWLKNDYVSFFLVFSLEFLPYIFFIMLYDMRE